jgi:lipopolysaccharide/colanic/teichoic acid biosynthesis glycosyltransferase
VFGPPYPYFDRRGRQNPIAGWRLRLHRSPAWRAVAGDVPPPKRVVDVVGALALVLGLAPVFAVLASVVKLQDGGSVLVWQTRVGRRGRCFALPRFRAVGRFGRFIRRYHFDGLPQLWNVLSGDLSLVGPRPVPPRDVDRSTPRDLRRLEVAPGLTGSWRVDGGHELESIDDPNLWRDVVVLLRTPPAVLFAATGRRAAG